MAKTEPLPRHSGDAGHAGVRIPPPLLFLGGLLLGLALEWLWPLDWLDGLAPLLRYGVGGALIVAGVALMLLARARFLAAGTAIPPWEPSTALVTAGAYRFSRNPMYLSMVTIYLGLTLAFAAAWALPVLILVLLVLHMTVIRREEAYLERRFGEGYRQYRARVRRWI